MDCSTFSNRTDADNDNVTQGDVIEKYFTLKQQYELVVQTLESTKQDLYETKRCYQTATDLQDHLRSELESYQNSESKEKIDLTNKIHNLQEEIQNLRDERIRTAEQHQVSIEKLSLEIKDLKDKISLKNEELKIVNQSEKSMYATGDDSLDLKNENDSLKIILNEQNLALEESRALVLQLREELTNLNEELLCVKSNLNGKKEELDSATELLRATQSDLAIVNCDLQRLNNEGVEHAAKGNSLFAEVEDKRQEMAKTLLQMKLNNAQLKRELTSKQAEIDTLLCEKKNIWEEYVSMASRCDEQLIEAYEQRITDLAAINKQQRSDLAKWFSRCNFDPQLEEWLSGVMAHLKGRCESLTSDLMAASIDNISKASQIRALHKQLASLKLKTSPQHSNETSFSQKNPAQMKNVLQPKKENLPPTKSDGKSSRSIDKDVKKKVTF